MAAGNSPSIRGFDPRNVPGCALWLDAADASTLTGTTSVTAWKDKSGNGNNAVFTGTNPSYTASNSYVETSNLNQAFSVPGTIFNTVGGSLFIVYADKQQSPDGMLYAISAGYTPSLFNQSLIRSDGYSYALGGVALPGDTFRAALNTKGTILYSINYVYNTVNYTVTVNGTVFPFTSTYGTAVVVPSGSLVFSGGWGGPENIKFNEILFFNSILTSSQRQTIEGYLAHKWGLNTALVGGLAKPTQIPGCALWLDAADTSTVTGTTSVTQWRDKSSNAYLGAFSSGRNFSYAANVRNGLSAIQTATGQTMTIPNFAIRQTMSIFHVYMPINQATGSAFIEQGPGLSSTTPGFWFFARTNEQFRITTAATTNAVNVATVSQSNVWQILGGISPDPANANQMTFRLNGVVQVSGTATPDNALITNTLYINGRANTDVLSYPTYIGEILIFNTALDPTQRQSVEGYLATKWGLRASLPATHPSYTGIAAQPFALVRPFTRAFQPIDIPGCALWLDAADGSTVSFSSGSNVSVWRDKSGNGNDATPLSVNPTYSAPGVLFANTPMKTSKNVINSASFSMFSVVNTSYSGTTDAIICGAWKLQYGSFGLFSAKTPTIRANISTGTTYAVAISDSTPLINLPKTILGLVVSGDTASSFGTTSFNGIPTTTSVTGSNYAGQDEFFGVGCVFEGGLHYYPLQSTTISEIIVFKTALTTAQRQQVEGYLGWKWGLNAQLPGVPLNPKWQSGLALWLDAADPLGTGVLPSAGTLATWVDKSGNGRNGTGTGTVPSFALSPSRVTFGGAGFYSTTLSAVPTAETVFFVSSTTSTAQITQIGCSISPTGGRGIFQLGGSMTLTSYAVNDRATQTGALTTGVPFITSSVFSGGNSQMFVNGVGGTVAGSTSFTGGGTTNIGAFTSRLDIAFPGAIYEVILFNTALTTSQRQGVEGYLAAKWGLTVPTSTPHPFFRLPASSVALFSPTMISDCALWLDAADASTISFSSGSNVSQWRDKSGNGYVSSNLVGTSTLAQTSLNGFASVYTPLSNIMGINNFTWRTKFVAFIVGKSSVGRYLLGHLTSLFIYTGNDDLMAIPGTGGTYFGVQDSVLSTGVSITGSNNPFMLAIGYDNATSSNANPYTLNGTTRGTRVPGTSSIVSDQNVTKTFYINSTNGTGGNTYDNVNTAEILIYNTTLTTSQRQQVEGYLAHKWGLNGNLPSAHPYTKFAPSTP